MTKRLVPVQLLVLLIWGLFAPTALVSQERPLIFATVERPPFAMLQDGQPAGFSVELMQAIAEDLGQDVQFRFVDQFPEMLAQVERGEVHGAVANISITRAREAVLDFTQPIFESGLQIMVEARTDASHNLLRVIFSRDVLLSAMAAFAALFGLGMLMWVFEKGKQPYFDRPIQEAMFPSFWWALNLVVNGGFEERMPRSVMGRFFGVLLVISSLFVVSIFVAHITAQMTVQAITETVDGIEDLDGRRVGTTQGSSTSAFLDERGMPHRTFESFAALLEAFEADELDAVVFDGPLLAYYLQTQNSRGRLVNREFRTENYGIALPAESLLREPINVALLRLRESGAYRELRSKWFGGL